MRIVLISDAWHPQVNGVVRTLEETSSRLADLGHDILMITPDRFVSMPCPTYPEIRLALVRPMALRKDMDAFDPHAIHIATEGPLGLAGRRYCLRRGVPFTTAFHTRFPDYVAARTGLSPQLFWRYLRWFHGPSTGVLAATDRLADELTGHGIGPIRKWGRGVDVDLFRPDVTPDARIAALSGPVQLYVGRVAIEKNLAAFLSAPTPGSKVIVGGGPALESLQSQYPQALFTGPLKGEALAAAYAAADVFVFPSLTDTFGLVMIEAMASGLPVAAFPVAGPLDIIGADGRGVWPGFASPVGALDDDLTRAIHRALECKPDDCLAYARYYSWSAALQQFLDALELFSPRANHALLNEAA